MASGKNEGGASVLASRFVRIHNTARTEWHALPFRPTGRRTGRVSRPRYLKTGIFTKTQDLQGKMTDLHAPRGRLAHPQTPSCTDPDPD